jgi:hypothetical protein
MPPKRFLLLISLIVSLVAAEAAVLHAATKGSVLPAQVAKPTISSEAIISEKKILIAPRRPLFYPPRLPPNKMRTRRAAAAP